MLERKYNASVKYKIIVSANEQPPILTTLPFQKRHHPIRQPSEAKHANKKTQNGIKIHRSIDLKSQKQKQHQ